MKKIVINRCFGGFDLSISAKMFYIRKKYPNSKVSCKTVDKPFHSTTYYVNGKETYPMFNDREDINLIETVEKFGSEKASGKSSKLKIVEIPDDVKYEISEYDGVEMIEEVHRKWC